MTVTARTEQLALPVDAAGAALPEWLKAVSAQFLALRAALARSSRAGPADPAPRFRGARRPNWCPSWLLSRRLARCGRPGQGAMWRRLARPLRPAAKEPTLAGWRPTSRNASCTHYRGVPGECLRLMGPDHAMRGQLRAVPLSTPPEGITSTRSLIRIRCRTYGSPLERATLDNCVPTWQRRVLRSGSQGLTPDRCCDGRFGRAVATYVII